MYLLQTFACRGHNTLPGRTSGPATSFFVAWWRGAERFFNNRFQGLMIRLYINGFSINLRMELLAPISQGQHLFFDLRISSLGRGESS